MNNRHTLALLVFCLLAVGAVLCFRRQHNPKATLVGDEFYGVSLAMQNYISANASLPPAVGWSDQQPSAPLFSWRLKIQSFLEGFGYPGTDFRSAWNSESNSQLHKMPTSLALSFRSDDNLDNFARIYAVTGDDTAFGPADSTATGWNPDDLPSDTIIAIEVAGSKKHWMEPGDYDINTIRDNIVLETGRLLGGESPDRFHVIFADFEVWALSTKTPYNNFRKFLTITEAAEHDREELLSPHCLKFWAYGG